MDVYQAPKAEVATAREVKSRPIKGILYGLILDLVLSALCMMAFAVALSAYMATEGYDETQIGLLLDSALTDSRFLIVTYLIGGTCSLLGGYTCARYARRREYVSSMILATILSVIGALFSESSSELAISTLLTFLSVLAGAHWGKLRNQTDFQEKQ